MKGLLGQPMSVQDDGQCSEHPRVDLGDFTGTLDRNTLSKCGNKYQTLALFVLE